MAIIKNVLDGASGLVERAKLVPSLLESKARAYIVDMIREAVQDDRPYVQTYTIVAGSLACNAKCPYCVSRMTPRQGVEKKLPEVNWRNFDIAAKLAKGWDAETVLITSKGEATIFPKQITEYMKALQKHNYSMIELQTNGILIAKDSYDHHLRDWYDLGMTTMSLSIVHYDSLRNKEIFEPHTSNLMDLAALVDKLHGLEDETGKKERMSVRLSCIMVKGYIDNVDEMLKLIDFAKQHDVEQLTIRPVTIPGKSENPEVAEWTRKHLVPEENLRKIKTFLDANATELRDLVHGATVYDYEGQNICLSNCLTTNPKDSSIRQVIFFPDGHARYDWQHPGAILF